jgi:hypothetical protein
MPKGVPVRVIAAPQRDRAAVVGASILAKDASFLDVNVSRKVYEESGASAVVSSCDERWRKVLPNVVVSLSNTDDHDATRTHGVHARLVRALRQSVEGVVERASGNARTATGQESASLLAKFKTADELRCKSMATTCKGKLNRS